MSITLQTEYFRHFISILGKKGKSLLKAIPLLICLTFFSSDVKADHHWYVDSLSIDSVGIDLYDINYVFTVSGATVNSFYWELFVVESGCNATEGFTESFSGCTILGDLGNGQHSGVLASDISLCPGKTYDAILYTRRRGNCLDDSPGDGPGTPGCDFKVDNAGNFVLDSLGMIIPCSAETTCGCPEDRSNTDATAFGVLTQWEANVTNNNVAPGDPPNIWVGAPLNSLGDTPSYDNNWAYVRTTLSGVGVPDYTFQVDIDLDECFGSFDATYMVDQTAGQTVTHNFDGAVATVRCGSAVEVTYNASNSCGMDFPGNTFEVIDNSSNAIYGLGTADVPGPDSINGRFEDLVDAVALGYICEEGRINLTLKNAACNDSQTTVVNMIYDIDVVYPTSNFADPMTINCSDVCGQNLVLPGDGVQWNTNGLNMGTATTLPVTDDDDLYSFVWNGQICENTTAASDCDEGTGSVSVDNCASCGVYDITYTIANDSCSTCFTETTKQISIVGPIITNVMGAEIGCGLIVPNLSFDVVECNPSSPMMATTNVYTGPGDIMWTRSDLDSTFFINPGSAQLNVQPGDTITFTPHFRNATCDDCNAKGDPVTVISLGELIVTCPADLDLGEFNCSNLATIPAAPTTINDVMAAPYNIVLGNDPCGTLSVASSDDGTPDECTAVTQTITRTIVITDSFDGRQDSCEFTFTIEPFFMSPEIEVPADMTIACDVFPNVTTLPYTNGLTNDCLSSGNVTSTLTSHPGNCGGIITETWIIPTGANCDRGSITFTRTYTVEPTPAPMISCPAPQSLVGCDDSVVPAADTSLVTASTTCGDVTIAHVGDVMSGSACAADPLIVTRTYEATNECGLSTMCTQTFTIVDDVDPVIANVADTLVNCTVDVQAAFAQWVANRGGGTVTENCSVVVWSTIPANPALNTDFASGPTTVQFVATDGCGLADTVSANFQVRCVDIEKPDPVNADNDGNSTISLGDVLTYTVTATNTGNVDLTNVVVEDPLLTMNMTMTCATVTPGATCVLTGTYTVIQDDVDATQIVNEAFAKPDNIDTVKADNVVTILRPGLNISKGSPVLTADNDMSGDISEGDVITYTVTATNNGATTLTNVMVTDGLLTPDSINCASVAPNGTCVLVGTYTVLASDITNGMITNTASAVSDQTTTPVMSTVMTPLPQPMATINKAVPTIRADVDGNIDISEGDTLEYVITVTNTGSANLSNVQVTDPILTPSSFLVDTLLAGNSIDFIGTYVVTAMDVSNEGIDNTAELTTTQTDTLMDMSSIDILTYMLDIDKNQTSFTDIDMSGDITEGDIIQYVVTLTNTGTGNQTDLFISDPTLTPSSISCPGITLPNASCVLMGTYTVQATDLGGDIINVADGGSDQVDTMTATVTVMVDSPSLAIDKQSPVLLPTGDLDGSGDISVGDILTYTIIAINDGIAPDASNLTDVVITDNLITPNTTTCPLLMPGDTCTLTGTYEVLPSDLVTGEIENIASANSDQTDMLMDTIETPLTSPSISLEKSAPMLTNDADGSMDMSVGDEVTYTITATNNGTANLTNVIISDPKLTPASETCAGPIMTGGTCVLTGTYIIQQADLDNGELTNEAIVTTDQSEPDTAENVMTLPIPGMSIDKMDPVITTDGETMGAIDAGDVLTYTIVVTNTSTTANLTDVVVTDPLLSNLMGSGCSLVAPLGTCMFTGTYTVQQSDVDSTFITNVATAVSDQLTTPISDTVTTDIPKMPSIDLLKEAILPLVDTNLDGLIGEGDSIEYRFTVTNTGNVTIENITIIDTLFGVVPGSIATLAPNGVDSLTGFYTMVQSDVDQGFVDNMAIATGFDPMGMPVSDDDAINTPIPADPILGIEKRQPDLIDVDGSMDISAGDTLEYTIVATNDGNVTLNSVTISDNLIDPSLLSCGTLAPGDSCKLIGFYVVTTTDVANMGITNTATADSDRTDPVDDNVNVSLLPVSMNVVKSAPVLTDDADGSGDISVGDEVTYRLVAYNTGQANLTDLTISDVLLSPDMTSCAVVPPMDSCVLEGTYIVAQANIDNGFLMNTGTFDADQVDEQTDIDSTPLPPPIVNITKSAPEAPPTYGDLDGSGDISVGDTLRYTIVADVPMGSANITDLIISDPLLTPSDTTCMLVLPGQQCSLVGTYIVTQTDVDNGEIFNTATAESDQAPTVTDTNTVVVNMPEVSLVKSPPFFTPTGDVDGSGDESVGDTLTYRIVATNTGDANLTQVTVSDPLITPDEIICDPLLPGDSCVLVGYYVVQTSDLGTTINNIASVTTVQTDSITSSSSVDIPAPSFNIDKPAPELTMAGDIDNSGDITVGDQLTYTITVTNNSPDATLTNVIITDTLLTPSADTCSSLPPGFTCQLIGTYIVTQDDVDAGMIENTAIATSDQVDTISDDNIQIVDMPGLTLSKSDPVNTGDADQSLDISAGDTLTYTIVATNSGASNLTNVVISDTLITPNVRMCPPLGPTDTCTLIGIYVVQQSDVDAGMIVNKASANSDQTDMVMDSVTTDVPNPSFVISKTDPTQVTDLNNNDLIDAGDQVEYSVFVLNTGDANLTNVVITDTLLNLPSVTCDLVPPGGFCTLVGTYTVPQDSINGGTITNTATGTTDQVPMMMDTNVYMVPQESSISLTKLSTTPSDTDGDGLIGAGDTLIYSFSVENTGNTTVTDIEVTDPLLGGLVGTIATLPPATTDNSITASYVITQANVDSCFILNTALAAGDGPEGDVMDVSDSGDETVDSDDDPDTDPTNDPTRVDIEKTPDILTVKSTPVLGDADGNDEVSAGDTLTYRVVTTNIGNSTLGVVDVSDPQLEPDSIQCTNLAPGDSCVLEGFLIVTPADVAAGQVVNTGTGDSDTTDPESDDQTTPINMPMISLNKGVPVRTIDADMSGDNSVGDQLTYTITATNNGTAALSNVVIRDPLISPDSILCSLLEPDSTCVLVGTYVIDTDDLANGSIINTATVNSNQTDEVSDEQELMLPVPGVILDKAPPSLLADLDGSTDFSSGDTIQYEITATNTGSAVLTNVTITDTLITPNTITCDSVAPLGTCVLVGTYVITDADISNMSIENGALVTNDQTDDVVDSLSTLMPQPDLSIMKLSPQLTGDADNNQSISAGDTLTYTIIATNSGTSVLTDVSINDPLIVPSSRTVTMLAPMDTIMLIGTYVVQEADMGQPGSPMSISNTATADADQVDAVEDSTTVGVPFVDLEIDKSLPTLTSDVDGSGDFSVGDTVTYTVTVTNTADTMLGGGNLSNVIITDMDLTPSTITCPLLRYQEQCVLTGTYVITADDVADVSLTNVATVVTDQVTPERMDSTTVELPQPNMELIKSGPVLTSDNDQSDDISNGDEVTYRVVAYNTGTANLTNITITDDLISPSMTVCDVIEPMDSCVLVGTYIVQTADAASGMISNSAIGGSDQTPMEEDSIDAMIGMPGIDFDKKLPVLIGDQDGSDDISVGDVIEYTLVAVNSGTANLSNVEISDTLISPSLHICSLVVPGDSCVLVGTRVVTAADVAGGMVMNTGEVTTSQTPTVRDEEVIAVPQPEHEVEKRVVSIADVDLSGNVSQGDSVYYEIILRNIGQANLTGGVINDPLITPDMRTCPLLEPLDECILLGSYVLTLDDVNSGMIANMALTTTTQSPPDSITIITDIPEDPSMTIAKLSAEVLDNNKDGVVGVGDSIFYTFFVTNTGNVSINDIGITDNLIDGPDGSITRLDPGEIDSSLTGFYVIQQMDIENGGVLNSAIGEGVTDQGSPVEDVSDDGDETMDTDRDPNSDPTDDPTFTRIEPDPKIALTKEVENVVYQENGDAELTFKITYQNTGNTVIGDVVIMDTLTFLPGADPIDQQFTVRIENIDATSIDTTSYQSSLLSSKKEVTHKDGSDDHHHGPVTAALTAGFNGVSDFVLYTSPVASVYPTESFAVFVSVEVNPDVIIQTFENGDTVFNQAMGTGLPTTIDGDPFVDPETNAQLEEVTDKSDDGVDPLTVNDRGDMDDPTIVVLPRIELTKELGGQIIPSALEGFFDIDFVVTIKNTGSAVLEEVCLTEDFAGIFENGFGGVPTAPTIISSSAAENPTINAGFDGDDDIEVTECGTGIMNPGDSIVFLITGSLEPGQGDRFNFADVTGSGDLRNDNTAIVSAQDSVGFGECADDLACPAFLSVLLDPLTCTFEFTTDLLGPEFDDLLVGFQLYDENGNYRGNSLTREDVGQSFQYRVFDFCSGNFCWGELNLELKLIPDPIALDPIGLMCGDNRPRTDLLTMELAQDTISQGCYPDFKDMQIRIDTTYTDPKCGASVVNRVVFANFQIEDKIFTSDILTQEITISPITEDMIRGPIGSGLSGFVQDSVLVLDCEDDIEPAGIAEKYGIPSAYPYVLKDSTMRDTILSRIVEVRDTVEKKILVNDLWIVLDVVEKRDSIVYDTMTLKIPQYIAITDPSICNWSVKKEDSFFAGCLGPESKVERTWSLLDWCKGSSGEIVQWINITDTKGPMINDFVQYTVPISPWVCAAELELPELIDEESCSEASVQWIATNGTIANGKISGLWIDDSPITLIGTVNSACGIEKKDTIIIYVIDASPPVIVAADRINVSVNTDFALAGEESENVGKIFVESIDLGSHDSQCGEITTCILRKENYDAGPILLSDNSVLLIGDQVAYKAVNDCNYEVYTERVFDPKTGTTQLVEHQYVTCGEAVKYCCSDVGLENSIVLQATDEAGLTSIGWTEINVEDKAVTECVNRRFIVSCEDDISVDRLGEIPVRSTSCNPVELTWEDETDIDACGNGTAIRTWYANGELSCIDEIVYETTPKFDPTQIKWPLHHTGETVDAIRRECVLDDKDTATTSDDEYVIDEQPSTINLLPEMTCTVDEIYGAPTWCDDSCVLIEMSYEDQEVDVDESCGKIIRRWTIIDWCSYVPNQEDVRDDSNDSTDSFEAVDDTWLAGTECKDCEKRTETDEAIYYRYNRVDVDGYYTFDQVIKINDDTKPEIIVVRTDTVAVVDGALSKTDGFDDCQAETTITASAVDSCGGFEVSTNLTWWVNVIHEGTGASIESRALTGPDVSVSSGYGSPGDVHIIKWTVTDGCGNSNSSETKVHFVDQKNPTPVCVRNITTTTMSETGEATIWAVDYDLGSYDNCGEVEVFFKNENGERVNSLTFDCSNWSSLNGQSSIEEVQLWAADDAGNEDFCLVTLRIQDNLDICPNNGAASAIIAGQVRTEANDMIEETQVRLNDSQDVMTGLDGDYLFPENEMYENYSISSYKDDSYLNGVTSLDLVMIQRHILGVSALNSPYKVIAADVNADQRVSSIDIIQLQKLLLGIYDELPDNLSWRFVDAHQTFDNPLNPWPFTEELSINALEVDMMDEDFIGVKIGDLNESAKTNSTKRHVEVPVGVTTLMVHDANLSEGQLVNVDFEVKSDMSLGAIQLTLEHEGLSVVDFTSNVFEVSKDNIGMIESDKSTIVIAQAEGQFTEGAIFSILLKVENTDVRLSDVLKVSSDITEAMAYDGNDQSWDLNLEFKEDGVPEESFYLAQNNPNPFKEDTDIRFYLPNSGEVSFRVYDISGKMIDEQIRYHSQGWNNISLSNKELNVSSGVYYYEIEAGTYLDKRKMIIVD